MTISISSLAGHARRPRIGVDFHALAGPDQGSRSHLLGLYREAVRRAPEYDFVFLCHDPQGLREADPAFRMANVQCVAMPRRRGLGWQLGLMRRRHRIDLLHLQDRMPLLAGGPCAVTLHDTPFESPPQRFARPSVRRARATGRRAVRKAVLLLAVSESSRREIARLYGVDPLAITLTRNGVDLARFHPAAGEGSGADLVRALGVEPGQYLLTVAGPAPLWNGLGLVRAYARVARPRPPLLVVGPRGPAHDEALAEVQALGLSQEIRFLEPVADAALPALTRHACVFVYPSPAGGAGLPVLEAMASGVPVVTSATTALAEVAAGAALTVDPDDPAAIAGAIDRLLADAGLRRTLSAQGLAVAARHRWDAAARNLLGAYRRYFAGTLVH